MLVGQARAQVAALDGDLPILYARPLTEQIGGALILFSLAAMMLLIFGMAGMALAALGTYGLVSYIVKQSTHEIGIRMALGASSRSIVRRFVGRGLRLGAIGAVLGTVGALGAGRILGSLLFGVSATDGTSFARALAIVFGGVIVATIIPAWRAARTNPLRRCGISRRCAVLLALVTLGITGFAVFAGIGFFLNRRKLPDEPVDVALVFGTGLDWKAESRVRAAAAAFDRGLARHLIVSGGVPMPGLDGITEAEWFRRRLLEHGVPSDRIHLENRATNTAENVEFSTPILVAHGWTRVLLIMSDFEGIRAPSDGAPCLVRARHDDLRRARRLDRSLERVDVVALEGKAGTSPGIRCHDCSGIDCCHLLAAHLTRRRLRASRSPNRRIAPIACAGCPQGGHQ